MAPVMEATSAMSTSRSMLNSSMGSTGSCGAQAQFGRAPAAPEPLAGSGTTRMPRPPSLVFDIELEESSAKRGGFEEEEAVGTKELTRWLLPGSTGEFKLRHDVEQGVAQLGSIPASTFEANQSMAAHLTRLGYLVHIRTALGGGEGFECLRNLRNVFLAVQPPGAAQTTNRFVVDLNFKAQFEIAKPTPRYSSLLACVPEVLVLPEASVAPLVNFLSQEMASAFRATGVVLPPWRQTNSMLSKWLPRKSLDEQVPTSNQQPHHAPTSGRRSMDAGTTGARVYGHWVHGPHASKPSLLAQQQLLRNALQPLQEEEGLTAALCPAAAAVPVIRVEPPQQRESLLPCAPPKGSFVKPISCEPKFKVVGGNFQTIGFP